jgi:hypothetical protein
MVTKAALLVAVHEHEEPVTVTAAVPVPPSGPNVVVDGWATEKLHVDGAFGVLLSFVQPTASSAAATPANIKER